MLGSLYSAVSGLSAHQTKMNVIGNNIANINTYGFKSSRVTFSDVFYQTLSTASASSTGSGGTNPAQLGYGAQINSIDVINKRAGSATTDRALDAYINGDGYLAVQGSDGAIKYTRVGILSFDASGNLADSKGNVVLGLSTNTTTGKVQLNPDGTSDTSNLSAIAVDPDVYATLSNIAISEDGSITATEQGDPKVTLSSGTGWITKPDISTTSNYTGNITLTGTTTATLFTKASTVTTSSASTTLDMIGDVKVSNSGGVYTLSYTNTDGTATTATGVLNVSDYDFTVKNLDGTDATFKVVAADLPSTGNSTTLGTAAATNKAYTGTTYNQGGDIVNLTGNWATGGTSISLGSDLTLTVNPTTVAAQSDFTNSKIGTVGTGDGNTITIGTLALVKFANADGLSEDGEGYYIETSNSGNAVATVAGSNGTGTLISGALEMSNVDLSQQLTEMIITQRGFQANSKMITVSDEMLETLVSMKR